MIKRLLFAFMLGALPIQAIYADISWNDFVDAAGDGNLARVKWLVSKGVLNFTGLTSKDKKYLYTLAVGRALGEATANGHLAVIKYLVENLGVNVNHNDANADRDRGTVLLGAADKGYLEIVQYLVSRGINVNLTGRCGYPALYNSANDAIWDYLKPKTKGLNTTLAFMNAARRGNLEQVKSLLEQFKQEGKGINDIKVDTKDTYCETSALIEASYYGHLEVVKFLVENGANVNLNLENAAFSPYSGQNKQSAMFSASGNGHLEIVKYLVENGADEKNKRDALLIATEMGHFELVKYLVSMGADVKINLNNVAYYGHLEIIKYLVSQGTDIDSGGAVSGAIEAGNLEIVEYALSNGAKATYYNIRTAIEQIKNRSPLQTQAEENRLVANLVKIVRVLVANGANVNAENDGLESALMLAILPTQRVSKDYIYLHCFEIVKILVNNGANVNYHDKEGRTALMYAVDGAKYIDITKYLLQHGASASINLIDKDGYTALDKAKDSSQISAQQTALLQRYGAKYNKNNKSSNSPKFPPNVRIRIR